MPLKEEFLQALANSIDGSTFVLGESVSQFEKNLSHFESCNFAVGTNNGTTAIELALRALDIGLGDEVITSAFTFVATVHAIMQTGAVPVLVDTLERSPLIDFNQIRSAVTPQTKAIIIVSLHGRIEHVDKYREIADEFGIKLILDGAQSHMARWLGSPLTDFFDAVTLSFYPGKNLGALGEGGAVTTDNYDLAEKVRIMRDWGAKQKYKHESWGGNFRLESIQAQFLSIKIPNLSNWTENRKSLAANYMSHLPSELMRPEVDSKGDHVYHIFDILVKDRIKFQRSFDDAGIGWGVHYPFAIHQNAYYRDKVKCHGRVINSENQAEQTFSLPLFPLMTLQEQEIVVDCVQEIFSEIY